MNSVSNNEPISADVKQTFAVVWFVAVLVAIVSAVPVYLVRDSQPWAIAVPIVVGVAVSLLFERLREPFRWGSHEVVLEAPRFEQFDGGFQNFSGLDEVIVVELTKKEPKQKGKIAPGQLSLFNGPDAEAGGKRPIADSATNMKRLRVFKTPDGQKLVAMDCDRFMELLVSDVIESFDKTLEGSLRTTLERYTASSLSEDQMFLISNKVAREVMKSDIRGNLLVFLAKNGELTIKKVLKQYWDAESGHVAAVRVEVAKANC